jgi:hypothetical protein
MDGTNDGGRTTRDGWAGSRLSSLVFVALSPAGLNPCPERQRRISSDSSIVSSKSAGGTGGQCYSVTVAPCSSDPPNPTGPGRPYPSFSGFCTHPIQFVVFQIRCSLRGRHPYPPFPPGLPPPQSTHAPRIACRNPSCSKQCDQATVAACHLHVPCPRAGLSVNLNLTR